MGTTRFYHLTQSPLESVLPNLLERALQAGGRVAVRARDAGRIDALDRMLWQGPEDGFLPHGVAGGPHDADQPVLLTLGADCPNGARCVMAVDGAAVSADECAGLERVFVLFDGNDGAALAAARALRQAAMESSKMVHSATSTPSSSAVLR